MKKFQGMFVLIFLCCLVAPMGAQAAADRKQDFFQQGNQAYARGQYEQALTLYRKTASLKGYSAALLYNMGNCYAKTEKTGPAILAYERALVLHPRAADIRANLALVRSHYHVPSPADTWWKQALALLGPNQWLIAAAVLLALSVMLLLPPVFNRQKQPARFICLALCALLGSLILSAFAVHGYRFLRNSVLLEDAPLLISPFPEATSMDRLRGGHIVHILKRHQTYVLIRSQNGQKGWLDSNKLARISAFDVGL